MGSVLAPLGVIDLDCDVTDPEGVDASIRSHSPDLIFHLASCSDVDWCQVPSNSDRVILVNLWGVFHVLSSAERRGCRVVVVSSDHIFSGKRWFGGYKEGDKPFALNLYGQTKMAAEAICKMFPNAKVVRTSYLFNSGRIERILSVLRAGAADYPTFIRRSFMHIDHFAASLMKFAERFDAMPDVLHLSGSEICSWYDFACALARSGGLSEERVIPRRKPAKGYAPRGFNLGLDVSLSRGLGFPQYSYSDGIRREFASLKTEEVPT